MHSPIWPHAIIHVDMDAFFAAVEQLDEPALRGHPVGVTNGTTGTTIITCSYEARRYGIRTGMRIRQARELCPRFIRRPSRPERYAGLSARIMTALQEITPDLEPFSVDEAFLDVTACQRLHGRPEDMAAMAGERVRAAVSGLTCSVGLGGDKTTAKYASQLHKPGGLGIIPPWETARTLRDVPVTALCGIGDGIGRYLAERGVRTCGQMRRLPPGELERRFGGIGLRIWLMCQGRDPDPVSVKVPAPKSIGHGKVMPPATRDRETLRTYLRHMAEKVAARLRRHGLEASSFSLGFRTDTGRVGGRYDAGGHTSDGRRIMALCDAMLRDWWHGQGAHQVQVTALDPRLVQVQPDLFGHEDAGRRSLHDVLDRINTRYGEFTAAPATLLQRSDMPNVISPAWKPGGHRETIQGMSGSGRARPRASSDRDGEESRSGRDRPAEPRRFSRRGDAE